MVLKIPLKLKIVIVLIILAGVSGVMISHNHASAPKLAKGASPWKIFISMPSLYPVSVTQAYGVSEVEDWTSPTIGGGAVYASVQS